MQRLQFNRSRLLVKMPRRQELSSSPFDELTKMNRKDEKPRHLPPPPPSIELTVGEQLFDGASIAEAATLAPINIALRRALL